MHTERRPARETGEKHNRQPSINARPTRSQLGKMRGHPCKSGRPKGDGSRNNRDDTNESTMGDGNDDKKGKQLKPARAHGQKRRQRQRDRTRGKKDRDTRQKHGHRDTRGYTRQHRSLPGQKKKRTLEIKRSAAHRPNVTVRADVWCIRILMVYYCRISNTLCGKSELRMAELGFWSENRIFCNP